MGDGTRFEVLDGGYAGRCKIDLKACWKSKGENGADHLDPEIGALEREGRSGGEGIAIREVSSLWFEFE